MSRSANFFKSLSKEDTLQIAVANYLRAEYPNILWLHVPNGGKRTSWERYRMSLFGLKKGAPDLMIIRHRINYDGMEPNYDREYEFAGLALELKVGKNRQEKEQKDWQIKLEAEGWIYRVILDNFEDAKKVIDQYLTT